MSADFIDAVPWHNGPDYDPSQWDWRRPPISGVDSPLIPGPIGLGPIAQRRLTMRSMPVVVPTLLRWAGACLLVGWLAACSDATAPPTAAPITVGLKSMSLTISATSAKAGDVTFIVTNNAPDIQHEFIVIKGDLPADQLTVGSDGRVDEASVTAIGEVSELDPGKSGTLVAKLDAGHYVLICNIAGHYAQGMHVDFTVTP